jgi:hypothetical protein
VDQVVFPCSRPALDPLLPKNRGIHGLMRFKPDETFDPLFLSEARNESFAVLVDAAGKI